MIGDTLWAATDYLGSVNQLLDNTGTIVEHREYESFGALDTVYDALGNEKTSAQLLSHTAYAGRFWDDQAGLYNNRERWYDADTGRFIGEDPARDGNNWYVYAGNNPITFFDPSGLAIASPLDSFGSFGGSSFSGNLGASNLVLRQANLNAGNQALRNPATTGPSFFQRVGNTLSTFASDYASFLGTELQTAGQTIVETGRSTGELVGDHASLAYFDPRAEASRVGQSVIDVGQGIGSAASAVYNDPRGVLTAAGSGTVNYLDQLTSDPTVSGRLLGNFGTTLATGGVTAAGKQVVQSSFTALRRVGTLLDATVPNSATRQLQLPQTNPNLAGTTTLGETLPNGSVFLRPGLSRVQQVSTLRHESVHAFFSPQGSGRLATFRQNVGQFAYDNSVFFNATEEILAEGFASGSLRQGFGQAFNGAYRVRGGTIVTPRNFSFELGAGATGLGAFGYGAYQIGGGLFEGNEQ